MANNDTFYELSHPHKTKYIFYLSSYSYFIVFRLTFDYCHHTFAISSLSFAYLDPSFTI